MEYHREAGERATAVQDPSSPYPLTSRAHGLLRRPFRTPVPADS